MTRRYALTVALADVYEESLTLGDVKAQIGRLLQLDDELWEATGLASVSVFAPTAMTADALATALFALGPEAGPELAQRADLAGLSQAHEARMRAEVRSRPARRPSRSLLPLPP